jgi:hypothetical protein
MRRRRDHQVRHTPYQPRPVTYDVEVWLPTVVEWNRSGVRDAYGETECPADLRPVTGATRPRNRALGDLGVFSVAHYELGVASEAMVMDTVHRCWAMMDEKHGRHWRPGDVFIMAAPATGEPKCPPGFDCGEHSVCVSCGATIHLGATEVSPGFGLVDGDAFTALILGNPPRCADCRGLGVP